MTNTLKISLIAFTAIASGCSHNDISSNPIPVPTGIFSGKFTSLHKKSSGTVDTLRANIQLNTTNAGLFKLTGDTSTVHAGSHGAFALNSLYIQFRDSTVTVASSAKIHLNGTYQYYYNGSIFQIGASNDTLSYFYDLKKI